MQYSSKTNIDYKSLCTNAIALAVVGLSFALPEGTAKQLMASAGVFALAGAITNWIAIHMLFERVPFLYGSGIIPLKFETFKRGISDMVMKQFFTVDTLKRFLGEESVQGNTLWNMVEDKLDYDKVYAGLIDGIKDSSLGGMLAMFGGEQALDSMKPNIIASLKTVIKNIVMDMKVQGDTSDAHLVELQSKVNQVVTSRLDELTPTMVKTIVQDMIRSHLGWLVIWGGVFGAVLGIFAEVLNIV